jgi:hypothetical protein
MRCPLPCLALCAGSKDPKTLTGLVSALNISQERVNADLMTYKGVLSRLEGAKEIMKVRWVGGWAPTAGLLSSFVWGGPWWLYWQEAEHKQSHPLLTRRLPCPPRPTLRLQEFLIREKKKREEREAEKAAKAAKAAEKAEAASAEKASA